MELTYKSIGFFQFGRNRSKMPHWNLPRFLNLPLGE